MPEVLVSASRVERWVDNFERGHGPTTLSRLPSGSGALHGVAEDGSTFVAHLPFGATYDGLLLPGAFAAAVSEAVPRDWGVLLVRKGGFAIARLAGTTTGESKTGQRHVQGRTKAGGQSQRRFARRRDNQARQAYEAAADHAARILRTLATAGGPVVVGGDRAAVEEVLADPRLAGLAPTLPWLPVPDPRRAVLEQTVVDACSARIEIVNA